MDDKVDIGLTPEANGLLAEILALGWFEKDQDVGRFALGYAVRSGVKAGATTGATTKWASGNFDNTGEIRGVVRALYPGTDTPVRLMEHLVHEGLRLVHERAVLGGATPADLLQ